jgi:integrase
MPRSQWNPDRSRFLSRSEIASVLFDLERRSRRSPSSRMNRVIFRLATCCGLRASEIAGIRLRDLQLGISRPQILIPDSVGKGSKGRSVPLWWDAATLADLRDWKEERRSAHGAKPSDPFVCALSKGALGNSIDRTAIRRRFLNACKALGAERLSNLTVHDGRHSFITHALAGGRPLPDVRDAAGHSSIAVTNIYAHALDEGEMGDLFRFEPERAS